MANEKSKPTKVVEMPAPDQSVAGLFQVKPADTQLVKVPLDPSDPDGPALRLQLRTPDASQAITYQKRLDMVSITRSKAKGEDDTSALEVCRTTERNIILDILQYECLDPDTGKPALTASDRKERGHQINDLVLGHVLYAYSMHVRAVFEPLTEELNDAIKKNSQTKSTRKRSTKPVAKRSTRKRSTKKPAGRSRKS